MILSVSFSKPSLTVNSNFEHNYLRIKIKPVSKNSLISYFAECFTDKQVFHKTFSEQELISFIDENAGKTFLQCVYRTETEEISILGNKKGHISKIKKNISVKQSSTNISAKNYPLNNLTTANFISQNNRKKEYLIPDGNPVPFLVFLGIMNPAGKVISSKYDKFRQINRFLEFVDDIIEDVLNKIIKENNNEIRPVRIADFGCGKSYLTFATYYYLTQIKKIQTEIIGLDLKEDVISYCNNLATQFEYEHLHFAVGNIADYKYKNNPDIVITLHACDTATDFALDYAIKNNTKAILSVPCCQHEINAQLDKNKKLLQDESNCFSSILKYGILKERFAAIATDALRAEYLEKEGYKVQILEFIDIEHTPKNLLIRAVKKDNSDKKTGTSAKTRSSSLIDNLKINPTLYSINK